jgi:hypothetical protein
MAKNSINTSKRWFLKFLTIPPLVFASNFLAHRQISTIFIDDDIVIINGWVLLKSDFH